MKGEKLAALALIINDSRRRTKVDCMQSFMLRRCILLMNGLYLIQKILL